MAEHSSGPWAWTNACEINGIVYAEALRPSDGEAVLLARAGVIGLSPADAALIAAAPDMLVALEDIALGWGRFSQDPLTHASNCIEDMKTIARAAIAKATQPAEAAP